jgi:hypothetical protein
MSIPYQYLGSLTLGQLTSSFIGGDPFSTDPLSAPETGPIVMIGSGLVFLSLVANSARKKKQLKN